MNTNGLTIPMNRLKTDIRVMNRSTVHQLASVAFVSTLLVLALPSTSRAQEVQADQAALAREHAPSAFGPNSSSNGVVDGHAVSTPNDSDLGEQQILKRSEGYQPFSVSAGVPFYWTSNAALTSSHEHGDFVVAPAAAVFYEPKFNANLYGLVGVRQQEFFYSDFDGLDFGSFDFEIGFRYTLPQFYNMLLRLEYDFNRLTDDDFNEFFANHAIVASAEIPIRVSRNQQLWFGVVAEISVDADDDAPRRNNYDFYVGYTVGLTRAFSINASERVALRDYYHQDSRFDVSEILALSANYQITNAFSAGLIGTFVASQSNHEVFSYNVANLGGVVSLWWRF